MGRKSYPDNMRKIISWIAGPDAESVDTATAMAWSGNTFSPSQRGGGQDAYGGHFFGDPGYGVNRFGGFTAALQGYRGVAAPVRNPLSPRLGMSAGVSGGMNLAGQSNASQALDLMSPGAINTGL